MKDLHNNIKTTLAVAPKTSTGNEAIVGEIIDLAGYRSCEFAIAYGDKADGAVAVLVEEDDDAALATAAAVADADLLGTEADAGVADGTAGANSVKKIGYRGTKRYVRLTLTTSSNAGSCPVGAVAILGHPSHAPVA